ncbi:CapA family protein [Paenibacillus sp. BC26]|uniref:CapA family protein n=1 Tax=Paenibacillus sp. BC26 TaxID=1881032 RepID=UPI0008ED70DB|nr:CapA family protein [Paenibacillus sp. BC26]SFT22013.1 poly-gamma-glutamate synthesis protein (capsule biosynthesis protein) [Paenibacillus sp. BC26]
MEFKLAAVGDILMIGPILRSAKQQGDRYAFEPLFQKVAPYLKQADLVIGNLETPLAGRETAYTRANAATGFSMFNCPDELAPALKSAGFDVLTTANNHCMDRGKKGLLRTIQVLNDNGLAHTGTYASDPGADNHIIVEVKGLKVGIANYSKGTNNIALPAGEAWRVNTVTPASYSKVAAHTRRLAEQVDAVIICLHIGKECRHVPLKQSRELVNLLLANGAHIILGHHPHVLQPAFHTKDDKFAIYSLGNFASTRLYKNAATKCGAIAQLTVVKDDGGKVRVKEVTYVPTWATKIATPSGMSYRVLPIPQTLKQPEPGQPAADRQLMRKVWKQMSPLLVEKHTLL